MFPPSKYFYLVFSLSLEMEHTFLAYGVLLNLYQTKWLCTLRVIVLYAMTEIRSSETNPIVVNSLQAST